MTEIQTLARIGSNPSGITGKDAKASFLVFQRASCTNAAIPIRGENRMGIAESFFRRFVAWFFRKERHKDGQYHVTCSAKELRR